MVYSRLYLFSLSNHFAFYFHGEHWFLATESSHACFLLYCWEICCSGNCGLWAKAFFPFNKLSRLSSIRTTFYYYCLYDCSTWLPKALLTLSVKPGLELWALAASLLCGCCWDWSLTAAFSFLFMWGRVQDQLHSRSVSAAVQVVLETCLPGIGVMRRAPFVSGVLLPVKKGSVHAVRWARGEFSLPGSPSMNWWIQGLGYGVLLWAVAGMVLMSDGARFLGAFRWRKKTVSSVARLGSGGKTRRWLLTLDKWENLARQDSMCQCISPEPQHTDSLIIVSFL